MATPSENKVKFTLVASYQSKDGSWKDVSAEREFSAPEDTGKITVNVIDDDGKTTSSVERQIKFPVVRDQSEALTMLQENPYLFIAACNYGLNLFARASVKGPIATEVEGPGKQIQKLAEDIVARRNKLGKPITMERALELAREMADAE